MPKITETYITTPELAARLKLSPRTAERMRQEGRGPRFLRAGRRVLYSASDVDAWLEANTFASTSEAGAGR